MSSSETDDPVPVPHVIAKIVFDKIVKGSGKGKGGKKTKPKTEKETKTKEFDFTFENSKDNYHSLLQTILDKHGVEGYKVGEGSVYAFKMQIPPAKVGEASDIDTFQEYSDVVKDKVVKKDFGTKAITITMKMKQAQESLKKSQGRRGGRASDGGNNGVSGSEDDPEDDDDAPDGLSPLDRELAKRREKLRAKYGNDHDNTLAYTDVDGNDVPLTVHMINEWARAMYDDKATVDSPPQTATFDPVNRRPRIRSRPSSSNSVNNTSQDAVTQALGAVSNALGTVSTLFLSRLPAAPQTPQAHVNTTPPPQGGIATNRPNSPIPNTPTKLERFLRYSEAQLGIQNAMSHEAMLSSEGYGPDILTDVDDEKLIRLGITAGDAIRLKRAASGFWEMEKTRPKRSADEAFGEDTRKDNEMRFEKRFKGPDGKVDGSSGSARLYGPEIVPGQLAPNLDYEWFYYSEEFKAFVPIPPGFVPVLQDGDDAGADML